MSSGHENQAWEQGWNGHETQQIERWSRLPLPDKLRWLEEAHHLVRHLSRAELIPSAHSPDDRAATK